MKKILIGLFVLVAIAVIAGTIFVGKLDGIIADQIRIQGTATLGAKVDVLSVETNLKQGSATINGLTIANPGGYQAEQALSIGSFVADVDYKTQVIKKIVIDKPIINAEVIDTNKNNFQDLLDGMPASDDTTAAQEDEELILTITELQLNNAQVNLTNNEIGQHSFIMDDFVVRNLTGSVDYISDILITQLINHVSTQVTAYARQRLTEMAKERAKEEIKEALNEKIDEQLSDSLKGRLKGLNLDIR